MTSSLSDLISEAKEQESYAYVEQALKEGVDPIDLLNSARQGMNNVGEKFAEGTYFIPELIYSGEILKNIIKKLEPHIIKAKSTTDSVGTVVIGTVAGDVHDIGKDLVAFMLDVSGFEVIDLGVDVPVQKFVDAVKESSSSIVGLSGFLTAAFGKMKETVDALKSTDLRQQVKIMIGGGQVDDHIQKFTGADAFGKDAMDAVKIAKGWIGG